MLRHPHFGARLTALSFLTTGALFLSDGTAGAADPFAENVRTTEPLSPQDQTRTFHLPPGFQIELVTSEPNIAKPMNMAFDADGRLWVTTSYEYPFPKKPGEPARDTIKILEDTQHNGHYDRVTTFAEGLNIPIAVMPYGQGCIGWSIPNIYSFQDTNNDGKADTREVLFGPLGWERDTHGNIASFRRGADGWVYGTHGFNNNSTFRAKDGSTIQLNSGNTYRFRIDGSHVEQYTWGQVNPFGMCLDERGYVYTADCHSSPIYQLIPGGYYPSFGKPDDGLGYAPTTIQHSHGSTAIAGIVMVPNDDWPEEFRGNLFVGNVMTSRINRDRIEWHGSSPVGKEMPDFLSTDDPWFRPVDIQFGPDGALYIADFYNRIIGHYEVPLTHPGRDRERARIWRVWYSGNGNTPRSTSPRFRTMGASELIQQLGSANPTRRSLALNELSDRLGLEGVSLARQSLLNPTTTALQKSGVIWYLLRTGRLDGDVIRAVASDPQPLVRMNLLRAIGALAQPNAASMKQLLIGLEDTDAHVRRAATESLAAHPAVENVAPLMHALSKAAADDTHLRHSMRIALKNHFRLPRGLETFQQTFTDATSWKEAASIALAVENSAAAEFLVKAIESYPDSPKIISRALRQVARFGGPETIPHVVELSRKIFGKELGPQVELLLALHQGLSERGQPVPESLRSWTTDLAESMIHLAADGSKGWQNIPIDKNGDPTSPWVFQERRTAQNKPVMLLSSLAPGGEALTGILSSPEFRVPARLKFLVAGHDGYPDQPAKGVNRVRLREVETGVVLAEAPAPRTDLAQSIDWNLAKDEGKRARLEVWDEDTGAAYAWIAVGELDPPVVPWPSIAPHDLLNQLQAIVSVAELSDMSRLATPLGQLAQSPSTDIQLAGLAARALSAPAKSDGLSLLGTLATETHFTVEFRRHLCGALAQGDLALCADTLLEAFRSAPWRNQVKIGEVLSGHPKLAALLIQWVSESKASPRLLLETGIRTKLLATLPDAKGKVSKLTEGVPAAGAAIQKLIDDRRSQFDPKKADVKRGAAVFSQSCAVCHRIEGTGNLIGPQLDGIGNRGVDRLCEDILDPNRNVDQAFRTQLLITKDGEAISGLFRREEGDLVILANSAGQEISIPKSSIQERRDSTSSLMPENFGDLLTPSDFNSLVAYLVDQARQTRQK